MKLYFSASRIMKFDSCPRSYQFSYVENLKPMVQDAKLLFGQAIHKACTDYLIAKCEDKDFDIVKVFVDEFTSSTTQVPVTWPTDWTRDDFLATGKVLTTKFPEVWASMKITPLLNEFGEPWIEKKFRYSLGSNIVPGHPEVEIIITAYPDVIGLNEDGQIVDVDLKTTASDYPEGFGLLSDQLTTYDLTGRHFAEKLGGSFQGHQFIELTRKKVPKKTGEGPQVIPSDVYPKRSDEQIAEFLQKIVWQAQDIVEKRYPRRPGHPASTSCKFCDFQSICHSNDRSGFMVQDLRGR